MFLISPIACVGALLLEVALYFYLNGKALESHWGDVRTSLWTALTRLSLLQMRRLVRRARHWRPNILVFVGEPKQGTGLVRLANWLNQNRGIVSVTQAIKGDLEAEDIHETVQEHLQELEAAIAQERMTAFAEVDVVARQLALVVCAAASLARRRKKRQRGRGCTSYRCCRGRSRPPRCPWSVRSSPAARVGEGSR